MRVNERVERLKAFFHTTDERASHSVQDLASLVASASNVPINNYPGTWLGSATKNGGLETHGASFQSPGMSDRFHVYRFAGSHLDSPGKHDKINAVTVSGNYRSSSGKTNAPLEFHAPVAYSENRGTSHFHFTTIGGSDETPLLTIAKTANLNEPAKVIVTSHSADGHRVAQMLTRRLAGIATQFRDEDGKALPMPEITLIKGTNVQVPKEQRKPTRREAIRFGRATLEKLPQLEKAFDHLKNKLITNKARTTRDRKLLLGLMQERRQLKRELANETEIKAKHLARAQLAHEKLGQIAQLAEQATLGKRGRNLASILKIARGRQSE